MMRSEASLTGNKMKPSKQRKLDRQSCMKSYDHNLIVWIRDCYNVSITSDEIGLKKNKQMKSLCSFRVIPIIIGLFFLKFQPEVSGGLQKVNKCEPQ